MGSHCYEAGKPPVPLRVKHALQQRAELFGLYCSTCFLNTVNNNFAKNEINFLPGILQHFVPISSSILSPDHIDICAIEN